MTDYGIDRLDGLPERVTICEVGPSSTLLGVSLPLSRLVA